MTMSMDFAPEQAAAFDTPAPSQATAGPGMPDMVHGTGTVWNNSRGAAIGLSARGGLMGPAVTRPVGPDANVSSSVMTGTVDVGRFRETDGTTTSGLRAGLSTVQMSGSRDLPNGGPTVGFEVGGPDASMQSTWGNNGRQLGATANLMSGAVSVGTRGTAQDESLRVGASLGTGAALRTHCADSDRDGHREYGVGADLGPFSFDYRTEDPVRVAANLATAGLVNQISGPAGQRSNLTAPVERAAISAGGAISNAAGRARNAVTGLFHHFAD